MVCNITADLPEVPSPCRSLVDGCRAIWAMHLIAKRAIQVDSGEVDYRDPFYDSPVSIRDSRRWARASCVLGTALLSW